MARFTPGITGGEIRGSIAGITFCRGSTGPVLRSRSLGPSRQTALAQQQASRLSSSAAAWRALSEADREAWRAAAEANAIPGYRPGLSGFQLYCAVTATQRSIGATPSARPVMTAPQPFLDVVTPVRIGIGSTFTSGWTRGPGAGSITRIRVSQPLPPDQTLTRNPPFHLVLTSAATSFTGAISFATAWFSIAGSNYDGLELHWLFDTIGFGGQRTPVIRRSTIIA